MASNPNLNGEIAARVMGAAKAAGITNRDLALKAGIADRTFSRLIIGAADWKAVDVSNVARVLDVELHDLLPASAA